MDTAIGAAVATVATVVATASLFAANVEKGLDMVQGSGSRGGTEATTSYWASNFAVA